jgi:polyhydroxyalkanoate synthase
MSRPSKRTWARIEQNLLVVTAGSDHIAPRTAPSRSPSIVSSDDVTHLDRPGGDIGVMAGSKAKQEIWSALGHSFRERSKH